MFALAASSALALEAFPRLGQISGPAPGVPFQRRHSGAVAVDDFNGHVLVADSGVDKVYDFASVSDTAPAVWDGSNAPAGSFGGNEGDLKLAVDNATGAVYVADDTHHVVDKFDAAGKLMASFGDSVNPVTKAPEPNGQLAGLVTPTKSFSANTPLAIAVDQATHDLYVVDPGTGHQMIDVFDQEGKFLPEKQITAIPVGLYADEGQFTESIAVNASTGHVFVADGWTEAVFEFDAKGEPVEEAWTGAGAGAGAPSAFAGYLPEAHG
jgi:DNA-binding beta-propeller fold protein YncE